MFGKDDPRVPPQDTPELDGDIKSHIERQLKTKSIKNQVEDIIEEELEGKQNELPEGYSPGWAARQVGCRSYFEVDDLQCALDSEIPDSKTIFISVVCHLGKKAMENGHG